MTKKQLPTPELLRKLLRYEPETGKLVWLFRDVSVCKNEQACKCFNSQFAGKEAFTAVSGGYRVGRIFDILYKSHRVIWAMETGRWPKFNIDHKNLDRSDNRLLNLREATHQENAANCSASIRGVSKYLGVMPSKTKGKWVAQIKKNYKSGYIGTFRTEIEAAKAYDAEAIVVHGEFANLNFKTIP